MNRGIASARVLAGNSLSEKVWLKQQSAIGVNDVTRVLERMSAITDEGSTAHPTQVPEYVTGLDSDKNPVINPLDSNVGTESVSYPNAHLAGDNELRVLSLSPPSMVRSNEADSLRAMPYEREEVNQIPLVANTHPMVTRGKNGIRKPKISQDSLAKSDEEPCDIREAMKLDHWKQAAQEEYEALMKNRTWHKLAVAILLAADCNPKWLTKHLPTMVPLIVVRDDKKGSLRLGEKARGNAINQIMEGILEGDELNQGAATQVPVTC
ncbi:hypothetical protein GQ457_04G029840 [Hibiscus cannabinus]